jgi:hypothetical protein
MVLGFARRTDRRSNMTTARRSDHYLRFLTLPINPGYIAIHAGSPEDLRHGHVFDNNKHSHIRAKIRRAVSVTNQQS